MATIKKKKSTNNNIINDSPINNDEFVINTFNVSTKNIDVAIVIAGRNNADYLEECIQSTLNQVTDINYAVIYVDDCSIDESLEVAAQYNNEITIIALDSQSGAPKARNIGWQALKADAYIFVDADDHLPSNYISEHLSASNEDAPFVYGPAKAFQGLDVFWEVPPWPTYDKYWQNTVNTSSLWKRWALLAVGGWDESLPTMWDWDLALRCSKLGQPVHSKAILNYRIHDKSFSSRCNERTDSIKVREHIRKKNLSITISSLISMRLGENFFLDWLDNLAAVTKFFNPDKQKEINLNLYFHNSDPLIINKYSNIFNTIKTKRLDCDVNLTTNTDRLVSVSTLLAKYSAKAHSDAMDTDLLFLVEDDIFPQSNALTILVDDIVKGDVPPLAVAGIYKSRHLNVWLGNEQINPNNNNDINYFDFFDSNGKLIYKEPFLVERACTGCLLFYTNRPQTPKVWKNNDGTFYAHDWAFCKMSQGDVYIDPRVVCDHYKDANTLA